MSPVIVDRTEHSISRKDILPEALKVLYGLKDAGYRAYLAGGGVRDLLLGRKPKDFDVATDAHPNEVRKVFRNCRLIGRRFRLAHVFFRNTIIEVSTFRAGQTAVKEGGHSPQWYKEQDGLVLRDNVFGTPEEDAFRRDFTVNALFYNIADLSIIDYVGGLQDLDNRLLRVIGDPCIRFREDPVRMLRAIRFSASLDLAIEDSAYRALLEMGDLLSLVSRDRLYDEALKLCRCGRAEKVFERLLDAGLFEVLFPDMGAWLKSSDRAESRAWLLRAARQLDVWKQAGMVPGESLIWALLLGDYHEHLAAQSGVNHPIEAANLAVTQHMFSESNRLKMPKQVVLNTARIMSSQSSFERTNGKRPQRFVHRPCFRDAFVYMKFSSGVKERNKELLEWWKRFVSGN